MDTNEKNNYEAATIGGGCFWCLEAVFDELDGVVDVVSGYSGGWVPNPPYKLVTTGTTGHAEVVRITFDPQIITFEEILRVFFTIHNPTTLNRQGADVGSQYRSAIFYHNEMQRETAEEVIGEINDAKIWDDPVVTEVTAIKNFYLAEEYHQEYFVKNPYQGYCQVVIAPKVTKFRKQFVDRLKRTRQAG